MITLVHQDGRRTSSEKFTSKQLADYKKAGYQPLGTSWAKLKKQQHNDIQPASDDN